MDRKSKNFYGSDDAYIPGKTKVKIDDGMKKLLKEHSKLKTHQIKKWLKNKVQFDKFKEPGEGQQNNACCELDDEEVPSKMPQIKAQYLMSDQEIRQNGIIEAIFTKFDSDGSGSLDTNEIVDLFRQNKVRLDKETIKAMF